MGSKTKISWFKIGFYGVELSVDSLISADVMFMCCIHDKFICKLKSKQNKKCSKDKTVKTGFVDFLKSFSGGGVGEDFFYF